MILLNFSKKMDSISLDLFRQMAGKKISEQIMLPTESSMPDEFIAELEKSFQKVRLTDEQLQADRIVINPPHNQYVTAMLLAYLLRKTGMLPYMIITRAPVFGLSARVEIVDVIDLHAQSVAGPPDE
jgi:hypothetical protein